MFSDRTRGCEHKHIFTVRVTERRHRLSQEGSGVSFLWDTEESSGHNPGQLDLGGPAWAGG